MGIRILQGGALTTIQDRGRYGYQSMGFSVSGVMDYRSFFYANMLLGRRKGGAVLEAALAGPEIAFTESCLFVLTGADMQPSLNGKPIDRYHVYLGKTGDILKLGFAKTGMYGYIAFAGELEVPTVMGSSATNLKCGIGGWQGRKLEAGDEVGIRNGRETLPNMYKRYEKVGEAAGTEITLRAVRGPEDDMFTQEGLTAFFESTYRVTEGADRMGYRLDGASVSAGNGVDIISNGIALGAVQIPPSGKPIIMMADRQTMGGYAKIANVITVDLPLLAQSRPGTKIRFQEVSVAQAQKLLRAEKRHMKRFYRAVN